MAVLDVKRAYENSFLAVPGVVGVGVGVEGIRIYVKDGARLDLLPATVEGYPVNIIYSGEIYAYQNTGKWRPISGGVSIGQPYWGTGTLSTMVRDRLTGEPLLLSNNHVLAMSNSNRHQFAKQGDSIIQPGYSDGGREGDPPLLETVARLLRWITLQESDWVLDHFEGPENYVDCALATPLDANLISTDISNIGTLFGSTDAVLNLAVLKSGRTSGLTHGRITDIDFTGIVNYGFLWAKFAHQIVVQGSGEIFSRPGDSGSLVVNQSNNAVGLLFAGNDLTNITLCNRISNVLQALNINLPIGEVPTIQNLVAIAPTAWLTVITNPVSGAIYIDSLYLGSGYARTILAAEMPHVISFGDVERYITPNPITVILTSGEDISYGFNYLPKSELELSNTIFLAPLIGGMSIILTQI